jgi:periplasmic protein CpxP/Spy
MFKRCMLALMLAGLIFTFASVAGAQDNGGNDQSAPPAAAPPDHGRGPRHMDPQRRTDMLTRQLKLTADQQPKVLDIFKSEQSQMDSLRSDSSLSQEDRRSKMMDIHKSTNDQIRGVLNPDQQKQWDEMQSRREQWQGHRGGEQAPPGNSPNQ